MTNETEPTKKQKTNLSAVKRRQAALHAQGLCICCGQRPSGAEWGPGATTYRCGICADIMRLAERVKYRKARGQRPDAPKHPTNGRPLMQHPQPTKTKNGN